MKNLRLRPVYIGDDKPFDYPNALEVFWDGKEWPEHELAEYILDRHGESLPIEQMCAIENMRYSRYFALLSNSIFEDMCNREETLICVWFDL